MSPHQPDRPTPPITNGSPPVALAQVRLFGDLTIIAPALGAAPLDLGSPTTRSLFAYLLLHRDQPCDRRQLALLFWPDAPETAARRNLRQYLHRLRRALEPLAAAEDLVLVEGSTVQL
ncbi:MAG: winged helix-turn-helix domain-containing protein, partial [Anaerolineae bacterium]